MVLQQLSLYMHATGGWALFTGLAFITFIQLFYYGWFFSRLAFYRPKAKQQSQQHPVSLIICARDEQEALIKNLPSVLLQQYTTTHEVIVVNDNSVDDSKYILAELHKTHKKLQVIDLHQEAQLIHGKKYPLSVGIKEARYEIVLLTDADCMPASDNWLFTMQDAFTPGVEVVLGYGAYQKQPGLLNKLIRFETFHTALQYMSYALAGQPYMGVGRNLAYRKDLFFRHKGFSDINHLPGGDDDLFINKVATKNNTAIVTNPDAYTLSIPKTTWRAWRRQKNRHFSTGKYYKTSHQLLLGLYSLTLILFYPLCILSFIFFDWRWSLLPLLSRLLIQAVIYKKTMQQLREDDLFPYFILLDLWLATYFLFFASAIWKKPGKRWK